MNSYTLKVVEIRKETSDTVTLCFKQPGLKKIKYQSGQYLTLILRINGRRYARPYSFSSTLGIDATLDVTVKRVTGGVVSNYINDEIKIGDSIEALPPMGDFIFSKETTKVSNVFFWGVGSGITPLFSIIKSILNDVESTNINLHLVYGNCNFESAIFLAQLQEMQLKHSSRLKLTHYLSRADVSVCDENTVFKGRIEPKSVLLNYDEALINNSLHYICGPLELKNNIKEVLNQYQLTQNQIFSEEFELIKDPKDFENIEDQLVKINFNNSEIELQVKKGNSILETALDAGIELPYSCQTGNCSMCKGILAEGEAKMIGLSLNREDLNLNEFLLCCTYPVNDKVSIMI